MYTLHLEHGITSFAAWQAAFDRDPARRQASGVRRYRTFSPTDDAQYIVVQLDFDSLTDAQAFEQALRRIWERVDLSPGLLREAASAERSPRARILEHKASHQY